MKTIIAFAFVLILASAEADLVLHGEGMEQLTANDIHDLESLAAEVIPGSKLAAIDRA